MKRRSGNFVTRTEHFPRPKPQILNRRGTLITVTAAPQSAIPYHCLVPFSNPIHTGNTSELISPDGCSGFTAAAAVACHDVMMAGDKQLNSANICSPFRDKHFVFVSIAKSVFSVSCTIFHYSIEFSVTGQKTMKSAPSICLNQSWLGLQDVHLCLLVLVYQMRS